MLWASHVESDSLFTMCKASIDPGKCIGCGLCVTGCPEEAMELVRREDWIKPVEKAREIGLTILKERGREKDIIPYMDPDADPLADMD